jgi:hypothetical protein
MIIGGLLTELGFDDVELTQMPSTIALSAHTTAFGVMLEISFFESLSQFIWIAQGGVNISEGS